MLRFKNFLVVLISVLFLSVSLVIPSFASSGTTINDIVTVWGMFLNMSNGATSLPVSSSPHSPTYSYNLSSVSGSGYVTTWVSFNGLPKNTSFKICIDYTVSGSVALQKSTPYGTGYTVDYEDIMHRTGYYTNMGSSTSTYNGNYTSLISGSGNNVISVDLTDNSFSNGSFTICYYCGNVSGFSFQINRIYFVTVNDEINDNLDQINNASSADKQATDAFTNKSNQQSSDLNDKVASAGDYQKPDGDSIVQDANAIISSDDVSGYNTLLSIFTNNSTILTMLLAVFSIGLVGYVLFGKR